MITVPAEKQNVTVRLSRETVHKAKILAAQRNTSISGLLTQELERLVAADDAYDRARHQALALMERGFALGGRITASRDELHER